VVLLCNLEQLDVPVTNMLLLFLTKSHLSVAAGVKNNARVARQFSVLVLANLNLVFLHSEPVEELHDFVLSYRKGQAAHFDRRSVSDHSAF
jgi:hypothetical protein